VARSTPLRQSAGASVNGVLAEQLPDAEELVVFREAVRAAERAGLGLAAVRRHGDVGDRRTLGFARVTAEDDGGVVCPRGFYGVERFGGQQATAETD